MFLFARLAALGTMLLALTAGAPPAAAPAPSPTPLDCKNAATTIDLDACAGQDRDAAEAALQAALVKHHVPEPLSDAWRVMRWTTCDDFVGELFAGGSISSMEQTQCQARLTAAFTKRISQPAPKPSAESADAARRDLNAFVASYRAHLDEPRTREILDIAESAWRVYATYEVQFAGPTEYVSLTRERIDDLKSTVLGERFW